MLYEYDIDIDMTRSWCPIVDRGESVVLVSVTVSYFRLPVAYTKGYSNRRVNIERIK
jgi:hypothetical protein